MRVRLLTEASADLDDIAAYISAHDPRRASPFVHALKAAIRGLSTMAEAFAVVPEYAGRGLRRRVYRKYQIFFLVDVSEDIVNVVRVLHSARDIATLLAPYES